MNFDVQYLYNNTDPILRQTDNDLWIFKLHISLLLKILQSNFITS